MRPDAHVFIGMPGYGDLSAGAARGFWRASRLPDARVYHQYQEGSLLAANFNSLWCTALNLARGGRLVDVFAMQHSDVEPEDWWLDALIAEMDARNLDVLGVAIPIKDANGLTSIALDRPDGDTWRPLCRLTMTDLKRLPETFTSHDVGHPILLNTGLWACRFDESWARRVRFTINDRIVVGPTGEYRPQCEPEDWYFSRLLHEMGLKVGCTRKIRAMHRGTWRWSNQEVWGSPHDAAWTEASPLDDPPPGRFVMPAISGWLRYEEGKALAALARGRRVLEVGSMLGLSTVCMAREADRVVSVDTRDGRGTVYAGTNTLTSFLVNVTRHGVADRVVALVGTLAEVDAAAHGPYDLAFIDGAHDRASVEADVARAVELLAPGGLLAFHDYRSESDPDVTAVVDELVDSGGTLLSVTESLAVVRPPAVIPVEA
jgi:hypothetical protein